MGKKVKLLVICLLIHIVLMQGDCCHSIQSINGVELMHILTRTSHSSNLRWSKSGLPAWKPAFVNQTKSDSKNKDIHTAVLLREDMIIFCSLFQR